MDDLKVSWYGRFPVIVDGEIYFVAGNDLFKVSGSVPSLCFQSTGNLSNLAFSGKKKIACVCDEDGGPDIYIFDIETSSLDRLTFFEQKVAIVQYDENSIYFLSNKDSVFRHDLFLYKYDFSTKIYEAQGIGPVNWLHKDGGDYIFQKYGYGYINWKGYKGGTAGQLWLNDKRLIDLPGNCLRPVFHDDRVFFLYDDGVNGNIYSCDRSGMNLKQHTLHVNFPVQDLSKAGDKLVYSIGGQIGIYDLKEQKDSILELPGCMPHPESRKFIPTPSKYCTSLATDGSNLVMSVRGGVYKCGVWSGGIRKLSDSLRFRFSGLLNNKQVYAFKDPPDSRLCIYDSGGGEIGFPLDTGKIGLCKPAPKGNYIAYTNHRHQLHIVDYSTGSDEIIFSAKNSLQQFDWSSDGNFLVYCAPDNADQSKIVIYDLVKKEHHDITNNNYYDFSPTFDPSGQYICFLSNRSIKCVHDGLRFNLGFENHYKPYLVSLKKNVNLLMPWMAEEGKTKDEETKLEEKVEEKVEEKLVEIDFERISDRIIPLPVKEKGYRAVHAIGDSRIILVSDDNHVDDDEDEEITRHSCAEVFCLKNLSLEPCYKNISYIIFSLARDFCIIEEDSKVKILKTAEKAEESGYKKGGVFDWGRFKHQVDPKLEWHQILHEVWWLIREFFWSQDLAGVDWDKIWKKYEPYTNNIRTKQELDDLINEIQGEVGTSHAFILDSGVELFGEKRGYLGADFEFDKEKKFYKITKIFDSNLQDDTVSPLKAANFDIQEGEFIYAIDGTRLDEQNSVDKLLCSKANVWVSVEIGKDIVRRVVDVKTIASESTLRYRCWVEENRAYVRSKTDGKVGYIHITDMTARGYKEFFQSYLCEYDKEALIIDIRYNPGGNVSCLLLDQLQRRRVGMDVTRWHGLREIPMESSRGAYVLLVNALSGSDAEIFSHQFKFANMGKVIGERTWGGIVGMMPRYRLVDGTLTSQPEFGSWFIGVGYGVENNGVEPDIEVINNHFLHSGDAQLDKAIEEALQLKGAALEESDYKNHPKRIT